MGERAYQYVFRPGIENRWYYSCEEAAAPLAKALARLAPRARFYSLDLGMGSISEAMEASRDAIAEYFGAPGTEPDFALLFRCDPGLPIPTPGQYRRLAAARRAMPPRIRLAGDYLSHATIEGAVVTGEAAATEIHALGQ